MLWGGRKRDVRERERERETGARVCRVGGYSNRSDDALSNPKPLLCLLDLRSS